jgi:hypothetical protein
VDLDFPEFGDPSEEAFQEEEVVLDRYAADVEIFANVPRVTSWEGRQLASMLWPVDPPGLETSPPAAAKPKPADLESSAPTPSSSAVIGFGPIAEFAGSGPSLAETRPGRDEPGAAGSELAADADPATFWAGAKAGGEGRDLIIVDDDAEAAVPPRPQRRQYRQLFSKLRRR